ncbi:MAG: hypothetical protein ACTSVV_06675, partial [Promethearchaeota archaeon]
MRKKNYWNLFETPGDEKTLPFLHGIEMEYFLLDSDFKPITDVDIFIKLVQNFFHVLSEKIEKERWIKSKVKEMKFESIDDLKKRYECNNCYKKISTVSIKYKQKKIDINKIDIIGKDTNTSTNNFTLELVTPPCSSVKELTWWVHNLLKITYLECKKLHLSFLPLASNPSIDDNFCGEHHHIGINLSSERKKIYNV